MITWSALHRALGLEPRPLAFSDFEAAAQSEVPESFELDWKTSLPSGGLYGKSYDTALDVAGFANHRGGMICVGVRASESPFALEAVDISESELSRVQLSVSAQIRPRVASFTVEGIEDPGKPGFGIMVLNVRRSRSSPHLVEVTKGNAHLRAPVRQGEFTSYMDEWELSRAYQARFADGETLEKRKADMTEDVTNRILFDESPWVLHVGTPIDPITRDRRVALPAGARKKLFEQTFSLMKPWATNYHTASIRSLIDTVTVNTRGPQCWYAPVGRDSSSLSAESMTLIYDDGSIAYATKLADPDARNGKTSSECISSAELEASAFMFIAMLDAHSRELGDAGAMTIQSSIVRSPSSLATAKIGVSYYDGLNFEVEFGSIRLARVRPTEMVFEPSLTPNVEAVLRGSMELSMGSLGQFNVEKTRSLRPAG
jgi:hypothetical protein